MPHGDEVVKKLDPVTGPDCYVRLLGDRTTVQFWVQFVSVTATIVYDAVVTLVLLKIVDALIGLRVDDEQETMGLDITLHDERGYTL